MIDGKVLKFGYGDIAIDSDALAQKISFQQFETPIKCGEDVPKDMKYVGEEIILQISYEEYCELIEQLNNVLSKNIFTFEFKGHVFDFTNYNEESVKACKKYLCSIMCVYFLSMAL